MELTDEIREAFNKVKEPVLGVRNWPSLDWQKLFSFYNKNSGNYLMMGCQPCYFKVYNFVKQQIELTSAGIA